MDILDEGLQFARRRTKCQLVVGDANQPPFGEEFALVGLFDVLEHLPNDEEVLRRMREILLPGGVLLLTVPADPSLWSYFDEAAYHVRRYELPDLVQKLDRAGFQVEYATHFMRALVPVMRWYRRLTPRLGGSGGVEQDLRVIPVVNELVYRILRREHAQIRARRPISAGTSLLAIARRPAIVGHTAQSSPSRS
jgi:SAM-dependent methyltransferase